METSCDQQLSKFQSFQFKIEYHTTATGCSTKAGICPRPDRQTARYCIENKDLWIWRCEYRQKLREQNVRLALSKIKPRCSWWDRRKTRITGAFQADEQRKSNNFHASICFF